MRLVPIECVKEGCNLARNIYDGEGRVLLRTGLYLHQLLLIR